MPRTLRDQRTNERTFNARSFWCAYNLSRAMFSKKNEKRKTSKNKQPMVFHRSVVQIENRNNERTQLKFHSFVSLVSLAHGTRKGSVYTTGICMARNRCVTCRSPHTVYRPKRLRHSTRHLGIGKFIDLCICVEWNARHGMAIRQPQHFNNTENNWNWRILVR